MRFLVHHFTEYEYTAPICLGEHVLRMLPQGPRLSVLSHELIISPLPAYRTVQTDGHGNQVLVVVFEGETRIFRIDSRFEALAQSPGTGSDPSYFPLPWLRPTNHPLVSAEVRDFAQNLAARSNNLVFPFLDFLSETLFNSIVREIRLVGNAQSASETLRTRRGACRDLTVLFVDCCRALGLTARFVSGYQSAAQSPRGQNYLHAWPEVYLPGIGWKGYDPTYGVQVKDGHVPLCAAPNQADTMPVEGGFQFEGSRLSSTLRFGVDISTSS